MTRTIQGPNLELWEAYASSGDFGFPDHARILFHCLSDRTLKARFIEREGDKADAESDVATLPEAELAELLAAAREVK